ncbi:DNA methyltransferase [Massilia genomosp. 1]|uniref:site-specific DNA-methyltransferase (cytosine-N(4)-specific) n=1 Tax=Massilia genomosp. 1 TaxID=2609280 RepID=A0ABX0MH25_9BURK|nr:DNA methyltransferase [Massilia genomosp. 1]NHZ61317.1 DNA modification methylase [Massilia genomosp. 1]
MKSAIQEELFDLPPPPKAAGKSRAKLDAEQSGTFSPNMKLPVHRWFRYSAGFSADWVASVIAERNATTVLDPFVGSGTVCVEADRAGIRSYGVESHPFVYRLAKGKVSWPSDVSAFRDAVADIEARAQRETHESQDDVPDLLAKCFTRETLSELLALRRAYLAVAPGLDEQTRSLIFLALNAILRPSSHVGTAQWQYVLPNKTKVNVSSPAEALTSQAIIMASDMETMQRSQKISRSTLLQADARSLEGIPDRVVDLVITSPPYANNYDYADATRLEMTFWGEVNSWGDLHEAVRKYLICSSSQHASKEKLNLEQLLDRPSLGPIREELSVVCNELAIVRATKGGNKAYHTMIAAYFSDMADTFTALRRVTTKSSNLCLVIGDSAPYGVHAPVERWFGELAVAAGFESWEFEKIRERNVKWKNRKHTVPLHEGRLWIKG